MMTAPDTILYPVADAMGMLLHEMDDGKIRGADNRKVKLGPWSFQADVSVVSDIVTPTTASFFVKIVGHLWLYVVSRANVQLAIYVVDGSLAKLHVKDCTSYGGKSVTQTLEKLAYSVITAYQFNEETKLWEEDANHLAHLSPQKPGDMDVMPKSKSAPLALPGPSAIQ
jgi:hypothetical protein